MLACGRISELDAIILARLLDRDPGNNTGLAASVAGIISDVRSRGDEALQEMAMRFDQVALDEFEIPQDRWVEAKAALDPRVNKALERAAENIWRFHEAQIPEELTLEVEPGGQLTRAWQTLGKAGVYAPGGQAAYPSSVLMGVVPAKAAQVGEVVVCSPPDATGMPASGVLAACAIGHADRLFAVGGAGAIAALTYGTETIPSTDTVVGPGNRWVTEAKRQVAGDILIDTPAGPSEVLVLADSTADPYFVALELLAQAEHDADTSCVLVTTSEHIAKETEAALSELLEKTPRSETCRQALKNGGAILRAGTFNEALTFTENYAPEHLSLMTQDPAAHAKQIRAVGTVFFGSGASVAFGDYITGANHVLPTAGRARSFSGLSAQHFLRSYTIQEIDTEGARSMAADLAVLAEEEGLPAHAAAALARRV